MDITCNLAVIDPDDLYSIGEFLGYVDGEEYTYEVNAPFDTLSISNGVYNCGDHEFNFVQSQPDWL